MRGETGVFATEDEQVELRELACRGSKPSAIAERKRLNDRIYELAIAHGLPEITGRYYIIKGQFCETA